MNYNPFDLVPMLVNGKPIQGRPFEFDSDIANQKTLTNAFGVLVKPSKVMTMCPDCGAGFQVGVVLGEPPFPAVAVVCPFCKPAPLPLTDPFVNPVLTGRIPAFELDPLLSDPQQALAPGDGVVADRFEMPAPGAVVPLPDPPSPPLPARPKHQQKLKKGQRKARPAPSPLSPQPVETRPVETQSVEGKAAGDDPLTLTRVRKAEVEKAEGLQEEGDFDDSDMVEDT